MRTIDTWGLSCPQPLVLFHQAIAENADTPLDVLVDNEASLENVTRAAEKRAGTSPRKMRARASSGWNSASEELLFPFSRSVSRKPRKGASPPSRTSTEYGFLVFQHTGEVIRAERILREAGFAVEVKGASPELRTGCDMIIVFDLMQEPLIRNALGAARLEPIQSVPMRDTLLEPVSLFHVQDYGDWFMVRAANMKITVERATGKIVNVSGGGCPDVPYLAALLTGQCIGEAEEPRVKGQTLCSYSLQRAFEEARRLWRG